MQTNFSRIFKFLDENGCPPVSKVLIMRLAKTPTRMTEEAVMGGTDTGPLFRIGLIHRRQDGKVLLTKRAERMLN